MTISKNVKKIVEWVNSGNTVSDHFLKTRLSLDEEEIRYYLDHKILYRRTDGKYILNRG